MKSYDVAVVGGRVAGAATAMLLARAGLRVTVVDRARPGTDTVSTHGLMRAGVLQLSRWGLLPRLVAAGTPPITRTVFHYRDRDPVTVSIRPSAGVPALFAPRRHILDAILADAAAEEGAHVRYRMPVTGLLRDERGRVTGVAARAGDGSLTQIRATVTVGADGVGSLVARETAAPVTRRGSAGSAVLYGYVADLAGAGYEWAYGDGAAAGVLPTNGGEACVFAATTPERMRALRADGIEAAFRTVLSAASPALAERVEGSSALDRIRGWRGMPGIVRRPFGPGWALVGDAGLFRDPISSHGMTDALRDAEILASGILEMLWGGVPEQVALGGYQALRDRLSLRMFDAVDRIAAYDWSPERVDGLLRAHSGAMSDEIDYLSSLPADALVSREVLEADTVTL